MAREDQTQGTLGRPTYRWGVYDRSLESFARAWFQNFVGKNSTVAQGSVAALTGNPECIPVAPTRLPLLRVELVLTTFHACSYFTRVTSGEHRASKLNHNGALVRYMK